MAGLLDFVNTPQGQGLLSAAFGGLAGARRGQPINSLGRAGLAGLAGYSGAQDRIDREQENAVQKQFREMQMGQMRTQMDREKDQQEWRAGLPAMLQQPNQPVIDQFNGVAPVQQADPAKLQNYLMDPRSPFADKLLEQRLFPKAADHKVVGDSLLRIGPDGVTPVYSAPAKPEGKPTKVQEYEYAKANGYKGSLEQYVSIGPSITAGALAGLRNAQIDNIVRENDYNLPPPVAAPRSQRPAPAGGATVSVNGTTFSFPNAAAAAAFRKQAGIK